MRIKLKIQENALSLPLPATCLLEAQKDIAFRNADRGLRHPASIYRQSLQSVVMDFKRVLDALDDLRRAADADKLESNAALILRRNTHALIQTIFEHFEHCQSIIELSAQERGMKADKLVRGFKETIREARAFAAKQANAIKHSQGAVRLLQIDGQGVWIPGHFIDGVDTEGAVSPNPNVHQGGRTAFSYGRALRYFACSIRFASGVLASSLDAKRLPNESELGLGPLADIFSRLAEFGRFVFPDEGKLVVPSIAARGSTLVVEFPSREEWPQLRQCQITMTHVHDEVMPTFRLPYMGDWNTVDTRKK